MVCLFLASICLWPYSAGAQQVADTASRPPVRLNVLYANLGVGFSSENYINLGLSFLLSNGWGGSVSYTEIVTEADELPSDYQNNNWFGGEDDVQYDYMDLVAVRAAYSIPTGSQLVRFVLEAGPFYARVNTAHFTPVAGILSNYDVSYTVKNGFGFSLHPVLEFPLTRIAGLEAGCSLFLGGGRVALGFDLNLMLGKVRRKRV